MRGALIETYCVECAKNVLYTNGLDRLECGHRTYPGQVLDVGMAPINETCPDCGALPNEPCHKWCCLRKETVKKETMQPKTKGKAPETILQEAARLVDDEGGREADYGAPQKSFERIAIVWETILNVQPITPTQVALCMIALKLVRETNKHKRDNLTDIAGYARLLERLHEE